MDEHPVVGPLVRRLGSALLALVLLATASALLTGYGDVSALQVAGRQPFALPEGDDRFDALSRSEGQPPGRSAVDLSLKEERVDGRTQLRLRGSLRLTLPAGDPLTDAVAAGRFRMDGRLLASSTVARVDVSDGEEPLWSTWSSPTVEQGPGDDDVITVRMRSDPLPQGLLQLEVATPPGPVEGTVGVTVDSESLPVAAARPQEIVTEQSPTRVSAQLRPFDLSEDLRTGTGSSTLTVLLGADPDEGVEPLLDLPPGLSAWTGSTWRLLWLLLPWVALALVLQRAPRQLELGTYAASTRRLVVLGAVFVAGTGVYAFDDLVRQAVAAAGPRGFDLDGVDPRRALPPRSPTALAGLAAALTVWAVAARQALGPETWAVRLCRAAVMTTGVVAGALVVAAAAQDLRSDDPRPFPEPWLEPVAVLAALALAVVLAVAGARRLAAVVPAPGSPTGPALAAVGVLLTVSVGDATFGPVGSWAAGGTAVLCGAAVVAVLAWTAVVGTGSPAADAWRARTPALAAVAVLGLVVVLPATTWYGAEVPVSPSDLVALSYSGGAFTRFALLAVGLGLLHRFARVEAPGAAVRTAALVAVAVLVLRPDVLYGGLPISFAVGLALTVRVLLVPRDKAAGWTLSPPVGVGGARQIVELRQASSRSRTDRDRRAALRRKVAAGELDPSEPELVDDIVRTAYGELPAPPTATQRALALSWAGERDAWRRGLYGALAATVVGLVLAGPALAQAVAELDALRGPDSWASLLTAVLTFRYPFYGLVFAFFLPVLRGSTGLAKAARLFVVLGTSEVVLLALPFAGASEFTSAVALRLLQLTVLCAVLGVGADLAALRSAQEGAADVLDLYHTNRLVLWSSGLALATATAAATALLGSAATLLLERILPDEPPAVEQVDPRRTGAAP